MDENGKTQRINFAYFSSDFTKSQIADVDQPATKPVERISEPRVAPDGTRIAFAWEHHIWVANLDGSGAKQVTDADDGEDVELYCAWSPNGKWLTVAHKKHYLFEIFLVPVDGKIHSLNYDKNGMKDSAVIALLDKKGEKIRCTGRISWTLKRK